MGRLVGLGAILALAASAAAVRVEIASLHADAVRRIEVRTGGAPNPVTIENARPGTDAWELGRPGFQVADDSHGQIKGYASATSVDAGAPIGFHVSVNPPQRFTIDVYRIGWYGGLGGRLMRHLGPLDGTTQPACPSDPFTGLIACEWTTSATLHVPAGWVSGTYLAVLTNHDRFQNDIPFVVRDDVRPADLLVQIPVNTYQAYNLYPDDGLHGRDLYRGFGPPTISGTTRAVEVSFDRPYDGTGAGRFGAGEIDAVRWLERTGYDATYATDVDVQEHPDMLLAYRGVVEIGHSEYWSGTMFDAAEQARDTGVGLAFFEGNDVYRQVRYQPSADGVPDRIIVCYKDATIDPVQGPSTSVDWRIPPVNRPEQTLVGIQYSSKGAHADWVAANTSNWAFAGTGMRDGDTIPRLVSPEYDSFQSNYPGPPAVVQVFLSRSPLVDGTGRHDLSETSLYRAPSGAWVFASGTSEWSFGLDDFGPGHADLRVERITQNVLDRFVGLSPAGPMVPAPTATIERGDRLSGSAVPIEVSWDPASPSGGLAYQLEMSADGQPPVPVDMGDPTARHQTVRVTPGHTYRFAVRATSTAIGAAGPWTWGQPVAVDVVDGSSDSILYEGWWYVAPAAGAWTSSTTWSVCDTCIATYHFTGRSVAWIAPVGPAEGSARVDIDGATVDTVSLTRPGSSTAQVVFVWSWPSSGVHTLAVRNVEPAVHPRVDVDAFVVLR